MTPQQDWFPSYRPITEGYIFMGDDHTLEIASIDTIKSVIHDGIVCTIQKV